MKHIKKFNENIEEEEFGEKFFEPFFMEIKDVFDDDVTITYDGTEANIKTDFTILTHKTGINIDGGKDDWSYNEVSERHLKLSKLYLMLKKVAQKIDSETIYQSRLFSKQYAVSLVVFRKDV